MSNHGYHLHTEGLQIALTKGNYPAGGAFDIGFGSGSYLKVLAEHFPGKVVGIDTNHLQVLQMREELDEAHLDAIVKHQNAFDLEIPTNSLSVVCVNNAGYMPKYLFLEFLKARVWNALKRNGIFVAEFYTYEDGLYPVMTGEEFVGMFPENGCPGSFIHNCGQFPCETTLRGFYGASFWKLDEILTFLSTIGQYKLIFSNKYDWAMELHDDQGRVIESRPRSMHVVTIQKR
jgi:hypothetical protein